MTVEVLVNAIEHSSALKGQLISIQDQPATWGSREGLPDYVIVIITGTTKEQAMPYMDTASNLFNYSHVTGGGVHTVTVTVDVPVKNLGGGFKADTKAYLEDIWGATFTSWTAPNGPATFEVEDATDLNDLKADILDKFDNKLGPRYIFSSADVDTAVTNGGTITVTKAQAEARIIDRYA